MWLYLVLKLSVLAVSTTFVIPDDCDKKAEHFVQDLLMVCCREIKIKCLQRAITGLNIHNSSCFCQVLCICLP